MKTKFLLILGAPLVITLAVIVYFLVWPWAVIATGNLIPPNPPKPEVTFGEFPFRLVYEVNGQRKVIEDTLICEFDGFGADEGRGKYRQWKQRLASGNETITLLKVDETMKIYYPPGSTDYYMGDLGENETYKPIFPDAAFMESNGKATRSGIINADQLLEKYNIKLVSWDYTPPIKNSFS